MHIDNVVIYKLDKWNWTYKVYGKRSTKGKKGTSEYIWQDSHKYYPNAQMVLEYVRHLIVDQELENIDNPEEALKALDSLIGRIKEIITIE